MLLESTATNAGKRMQLSPATIEWIVHLFSTQCDPGEGILNMQEPNMFRNRIARRIARRNARRNARGRVRQRGRRVLFLILLLSDLLRYGGFPCCSTRQSGLLPDRLPSRVTRIVAIKRYKGYDTTLRRLRRRLTRFCRPLWPFAIL